MLEADEGRVAGASRSFSCCPGCSGPYFIEYRMDELVNYEAVANYGALTREEQGAPARRARDRAQLVTSPKIVRAAGGDGNVQLAPEDNDPAALRYALWTATDEAYKAALRAYSAKQANLKRFSSVGRGGRLRSGEAGNADQAAGKARDRSR